MLTYLSETTFISICIIMMALFNRTACMCDLTSQRRTHIHATIRTHTSTPTRCHTHTYRHTCAHIHAVVRKKEGRTGLSRPWTSGTASLGRYPDNSPGHFPPDE